jgi:hypothetical protein
MLKAMLDGITDPATLAVLAQAKLRAKHAQLEQALSGLVTAHQRFLLSELLSQIDYLDEARRHTSVCGTHRASALLGDIDDLLDGANEAERRAALPYLFAALWLERHRLVAMTPTALYEPLLAWSRRSDYKRVGWGA